MDPSTIDDIEFAAVTESDWRALVEKGLKGKSPASLERRSEDGFAIAPLYGRRERFAPLASARSGPWTIMQPIEDPDVERANAQALSDLEGGATGLTLVFAGAPSACGFGLSPDAASLLRILEGVQLGLIALRVEADAAGAEQANRMLLEMGGDGLRVDLALDPLAAAARRGGGADETLPAFLLDRARDVAACPQGRTAIEADGRVWHEAGATNAQELACVLSAAVSALRSLEASGLAAERAAPLIGFTLAADHRQFETIAKLRALRFLWARVLEECAVERPLPLRLHVETSRRMLAARDPHTNILRSTIAGLAAAVGGADSMMILPHTAALGLADRFARRLARNTQIILQDESHLGVVADPAAGSGAFEALTDMTAEAAWEAFCAIEAEGGLTASLRAGAIQRRIGEAAASRRQRIAEGANPIVGVTLHPMEEERNHVLLAPLPDIPREEGVFASLQLVRDAEHEEARS